MELPQLNNSTSPCHDRRHLEGEELVVISGEGEEVNFVVQGKPHSLLYA